MPADNPASSLLGFKEIGSATHYYHHCTTVKKHIREVCKHLIVLTELGYWVFVIFPFFHVHVHVRVQPCMALIAYDMQVHKDQCILRDSDSHDKQCSDLEDDPSKSVEFGINTRSVLSELQYFHVASGALVPDIMHNLLEVYFFVHVCACTCTP